MDTKLRTFLLILGLATLAMVQQAVAARPTLTSISDLTGGTEDTDYPIAWATLLGASDANDTDGDAISFRLEEIDQGTLEDGGGNAISVGDTLSGPTGTWIWNPDDGAINGTVAAFKVRAFAGGQDSNSDVQVSIVLAAVNDPPVLSAIATIVNPANLEDQSVTVSNADLLAAATASDEEGTPITFVFRGVEAPGTMTYTGGGNVAFGEFFTSPLVWTPPFNAFNNVAAFKVRAWDGVSLSAEELTVKFNLTPVNDPPNFDYANGGVLASVDEDSGAQTVEDWAINIVSGPAGAAADEGDQSPAFVRTSADSGLFSVQPAINADGDLTFTPAPDENGSAVVKFKLQDNGGKANGGNDESIEKSFTITVDPVADKPVIGGTVGVGGTVGGAVGNPLPDTPTGDGGPGADFAIFNSLTITDVDHNKPNPEQLDLTVTVPSSSDTYGSFQIPGATPAEVSGNYVFTFFNLSPADAQAKLRQAVFTPTPNAQPVDVYSFGITVEVEDASALDATPLSSSIFVESVNDPPSVTASAFPATITDSGVWEPFRLILIDPDPGETFELTITETSPSSRGTLTPPATPITGDAAALIAAIQDVTFAPSQQSMLVQATFDVTVTDVHPNASKGSPVTDAVTIDITFDNDAPQLSGIKTELIRITDDPQNDPTLPFSTVTISDADPGQLITVFVELDDAAKGSLSGQFDSGVPGQITGTAAEVTDKLRLVTFTPTAGRVREGGSETVILTLTVGDGGSTLVNDQTRIEVTSVNGAPAVLWDTLAPGNAAGAFPLPSSPALIAPFDYVDPDPGANPGGLAVPAASPFTKVSLEDDGEVEVTISLDDPAKGEFLASSLGGFVETAADSGIYTISGTPSTVQAAIRGLTFLPSETYLFPPGEPGRTDFTISASDAVLNVTTRVLPIVLISDSRNFLVTNVLDDEGVSGSLRWALSLARNNDVITFALPSYPSVIRLSALNGPLMLNRHVTLRGPGSDKLTISGDANANGITDAGDVQLMQVFATVHIKGLKFSSGFALNGGAAFVGRTDPDTRPGELLIEDCIISDCLASQWGGAVDVFEGSVTARRCLFEDNTLGVSSGLGGGAVSIYTDESCRFENCTFSGNSQASPTGYGGGAIYVENFTPSQFFQTWVTHCTFAENADAANNGSSIHSNVANTRVLLTNSLFSDFSARNLQVAGSGEIVSVGGNISNDNTATTLIQGGNPQQVFLLSDPTDQRAVADPGLAPIGALEGPTRGYRLEPGSPAVGMALPDVLMRDQRGVIRSGSIDVGAVDAEALGKMLIHEIFVSEDDPKLEFIEFYNPRNQGAIDLAGYQVKVNGNIRHTFAAPLVVQPGFGVVLAGDTGDAPPDDVPAIPVSTTKTPLVVADEVNTGGGLGLPERGLIELLAPTPQGLRVVESVSYVAVFVNPADPTGELDYDLDSITLAPQEQGAAFVPNSAIVPGPTGGVDLGLTGSPISPGSIAPSTPFGEDNAFPFAVADRIEINEDDLVVLDVLANDVDANGSDVLFIVDLDNEATVGTLTGSVGFLDPDDGSDPADAPVTVNPDPNASPLRGTSLTYNPIEAFNSLAAGARATDTFAYSIIDVGGGPVGLYEDNGGVTPDTTLVTAPSHRLANGAVIEISGSSVGGYNGVHTVAVVDDDSFTIPVTFVTGVTIPPGGFGNWLAAADRSPTARSEALVEVIVLGRNDAPTPMDDTALVGTDEDSVLRIFGDREAADPVPVLDTDGSFPVIPDVEAAGILRNDSDPDTTDNPFTRLNLIGVCQAAGITEFTGAATTSPVTVTSVGHGLQDGEVILISSYQGHPSYNNYHEVGNVTEDSFTIPITFVDNVGGATKALWARLDDSNRFQTQSAFDATVTLEIRADRTETNIVYNALSSAELNALADSESVVDSFYYAVEDTSGAVSLALVEVPVDGVNDAPVPTDDPPGILAIAPFVPNGSTPAETAGDSTVLYALPVPGSPAKADVAVRPPGADPSQFVVIPGIDWTDEDSLLMLSRSSFLDNDGEDDATDTLNLEIGAGQELSALGATISLNGDASILTYDPTAADALQALAFKERVIDLVTVGVTDGISNVPTTFIVVVEGRNDSPVASNASFTTDERTLLTVSPPGLLNSGFERDQNTWLPDNRRFLRPQADLTTTVEGALVDYLLESREGAISSFGPVPADTSATAVISAGHGLQTGEEVVLPSSGPLTGQYVITRIDDDSFSIPVPYDALNASLGGIWRVLASTFLYDPRGSVFAGPTGDPSFTLQGLAENQQYVDTFEYTLLDGSHLFANNDIFRIEADRSGIELRVLENDARLDGVSTSHSIISVGPPSAGGAVSMNAGESIIYTPETGFVGDEFFTYTIEDDLGNRDTALVTARVTIDRLNGNLRANPDEFTVATTQSPLLDVLANDSIIPATGDPLSLDDITSAPDQGGSAMIEGDEIRYTPSAGATVFPYTETFTYVMSGGGTTTAETTVTVLVVDRRETLNARDDSFGVPAGSTENTLNVLENDNVLPANGEDFEIISTQNGPSNGTVEILNGDAILYSPTPGFLGTDTFDYTVADGFGGTKTASVEVEVGYLVTNPDIFSVEFDSTTGNDVVTLDVLANDNVLQGGSGGVTITSVVLADPSDQAAIDLGDMTRAADFLSLEFNPAQNQTGQADYLYTVTDSSNRASTGLVTVVVISDGVRASSDYFTVQTDSAENQLDILSNDLRLSLNPGELSIGSIGTGPDAPDQGGTVEIVEAPPGQSDYLVYTPAPGFSGTESFTYTVTDGDDSDTARVSIDVTTGAMVAADDDFLVFRGSVDNRLSVLLNDRVIPDGGQLLFITATGLDSANNIGLVERGSLQIIEGGAALSYTPSLSNPSADYTETFTYEISTGGTERAEGTISIMVVDRVGVRDLETNDDNFEVRSDSAGTLLPVLANDSVLPASSEDWVITTVSPATVNVCASFLFMPADFTDPAVFAATLEAQADPLTAYLWGEFSGPSQALFADPSTAEVTLRQALADELNALIQGGMSIYDPTRFAGIALRSSTSYLVDNGATGDQLVVLNRLLLEDAFPVEIVRAPGGGSLQIIGTDIIYVPEPGFVGSVRFSYSVSDGLGGTGEAEVIVKVGDVSVSDDAYTVLAGAGPVPLDVTANDGILRTAFPDTPDPAQADFTLSTLQSVAVDPIGAGSATVVGGMVHFTPDAAFVGIASLTYEVEDDGSCTYPGIARVDVRSPEEDESTAEVSVTVTGVNDEPMLLNADPSAIDDTTQNQPFANATVIEYDEQRLQEVTLTVTYDPARGTLVGDFTEISPGVLQFVGTAEEITTALRALVFTPVINRIPIGTTEDTLFSVSMDDGFVTSPVVVDTAVVTVTPVNDPTVFTGTFGGLQMYQYSSLCPFAGVNITDVDDLGLQPQTVTVAIDDAIKGGFSNLGGFVEQPGGSGIYVFTASPAAVATALRELVFTPTPGGRIPPQGSETAIFTVTVDDGFLPPIVDDVTTVEILHAEIDVLLPLDGTGADISEAAADFGGSVAIDGDTIVVGSPNRDGDGLNRGSVFVYERTAGLGLPWGRVAELRASDASNGDRFGSSVAISGDLMVIGAPDVDAGNVGAAYIFERDSVDPNAWNEVEKLIPSVSNSPAIGNDAYGTAVAAGGETVLVGSPASFSLAGERTGRVFVYRRTGGIWSETQQLEAANNQVSGVVGDFERFGHSLALDGDTAVIGAPEANRTTDGADRNFGAAYVFTRPGPTGAWSEVRRIDEFTDPNGESHAGFGHSVAISGDRIAVGVYSGGSPGGDFRAGRASIHERDLGGAENWGLVQKIEPEGGVSSTNFGFSVGIAGDLLIVGSPGPNQVEADPSGSANVYRHTPGGPTEWTRIDDFRPSAPGVDDLFGAAVAIEGFSAVIGAMDDGVNGPGAASAGSARAYQFQYVIGPRLAIPIPAQVAEQDTLFSFTISGETFKDPNYGSDLVLGVELANGDPLPGAGWLSFDPLTGGFSGTPTAGERRDYTLVIHATNPFGTRVASNEFTISVAESADPDLETIYNQWAGTQFPPGVLNDPLQEATVWGMDANPDGDGNANILDMLFGNSATESDPSPMSFVKLNPSGGELTFPLADSFPKDSMKVEWSLDMLTWFDTDVTYAFGPSVSGVSEATATINPPGTPQRLFVRIVTVNP